jgi:hypothetical protein
MALKSSFFLGSFAGYGVVGSCTLELRTASGLPRVLGGIGFFTLRADLTWCSVGRKTDGCEYGMPTGSSRVMPKRHKSELFSCCDKGNTLGRAGLEEVIQIFEAIVILVDIRLHLNTRFSAHWRQLLIGTRTCSLTCLCRLSAVQCSLLLC